MTNSVIKCNRCRKRMRNNTNWNMVWVASYYVYHLCPNCQTPEENIEAEFREITGETQGLKVWPAGWAHDPEKFEQYVHMLIDAYPTPEVMRSKANELATWRPDCVEGPVKVMRRLAEDMEAGDLWEECDKPDLPEHVKETMRRAIKKGKGVYVARDDDGNIIDACIPDDD